MLSESFQEHVPKEHAAQIVHYCVALDMKWVLYVCASESHILYTLLTICNSAMLAALTTFYDEFVAPILRWAHEDPIGVRPITEKDEIGNVVESRLPFWRLLRNDIWQKGPFIPVRVYKHSSHTLYNKTKGGVHGSSQMRAVLRCPSDTLKCEQKGVAPVLKSVTFNVWVAWRQLQLEDILFTRESFRSLEQYRNSQNKVESLADFVFEINPELLAYAQSLDREHDVEKVRPALLRMGRLKRMS